MPADATPRRRRRRAAEDGFTLLEVGVALFVLTVALLGLAQTFYIGMTHMATSSANLVAREKAREAVESVHTARDTRTITWAQVSNAPNGVFLAGLRPLTSAGDDGLVNTADDGAVETLREPGPDGVLGTDDDVSIPLSGFQRQIEILELSPVNPDLREVRVTITYEVGPQQRTYTLRTYISSFS
jgi:type II secretory pathway pseudopilin PulG